MGVFSRWRPQLPAAHSGSRRRSTGRRSSTRPVALRGANEGHAQLLLALEPATAGEGCAGRSARLANVRGQALVRAFDGERARFPEEGDPEVVLERNQRLVWEMQRSFLAL